MQRSGERGRLSRPETPRTCRLWILSMREELVFDEGIAELLQVFFTLQFLQEIVQF